MVNVTSAIPNDVFQKLPVLYYRNDVPCISVDLLLFTVLTSWFCL